MMAPKLLLAPMAGFTDKAMRRLSVAYGADQTVTEMVSAKAICYGNHKTAALMDGSGETVKPWVQLFGSDPAIMAEAARQVADIGAPQIDINMGCPVPKVVNNGEGSALLCMPDLAEAVVSAMVQAVNVPISVKMRIGFTAPDPHIGDVARRLEAAGAALITVHGRTRAQYYSGAVNRTAIAQVVQAVQVPVIANGDVIDAASVEAMLSETGAAGVAIGRGAVGAPWLFRDIVRHQAGLAPLPAPSRADRACLMYRHAQLAVADKGEFAAMRELRKVLGHYTKGEPGAVDFRRSLSHVSSLADLETLLLSWCPHVNLNEVYASIEDINR